MSSGLSDCSTSGMLLTSTSSNLCMTMLIALIVILVVSSSEVRGFQSFLMRKSSILKRSTKEPRVVAKEEVSEQEERSEEKTSGLWDSLSTPFSSYQSVVELPKVEPTVVNDPDVTHFLFLVHGHRGRAKDLSYLQTVMQLLAETKKTENNNSTTTHDMVVHNAVCNEQKTNDGVENGGERLVEEIVTTIKQEMAKRSCSKTKNITISMVGNSLGGIYARYAIARLAEMVDGDDGLLDGRFRLHSNVFCTTATPHLGISQHTYVPLPRTAEIGVAKALGTTGHDLFRLNDLMKTMATDSKYLDPLAAFRKRIAYANAYGTDFPVPPETAAFLSHNSSSPHFFVKDEDSDENRVVVDDDNGLIIATLHTPRNESLDNGGELVIDEEHADELVQMSATLDSLGWKKVFVDLRSEVPIGVSIPRFARRSSSSSSNGKKGNGFLSSRSKSDSMDQDDSEVDREEGQDTPPLHLLKEKGVVESRHVVSSLANPTDKRISLPVGHNMICAFSRSRISRYLNKGGRPVMDTLARELVDDIFAWDGSE